MNIAAILGYGAIGLGFLLAVLAYRLLASDRTRERPIYVFMVFCLALLGVGAVLQYTASQDKTALEQKSRDYDNLKVQADATEKNWGSAQSNLATTQDKLSAKLTELAAAQTALADEKAANKRPVDSMKAIVNALSPTTAPLQQVAGRITGAEVCNGGAHGEPLPGGSADGTKISTAVSQISAAAKIAQQFVQ